MNKYRAKKTIVDNITFASQREAKRYFHLKLLENKGEITDINLQPKFPILIQGQKICTVILDFHYWDKKLKAWIWEDSKGFDNPLSKLKRKLVEAMYGIKVHIV